MVEDRADHVFKRCGGGKTGTAEDIRRGIRDETADCEVIFHKTVANAADERRGATRISENGRELCGVHDIFGEACTLNADDVIVGLLDDGDDVEVDGSGEDLAVIVVGVVAANFTASCNGENGKVVSFAKDGFKFIESGVVTRFDVVHASAVIELCENVLGFLEKFVSVEHDDSPFCRMSGLVLCLNIDQ